MLPHIKRNTNMNEYKIGTKEWFLSAISKITVTLLLIGIPFFLTKMCQTDYSSEDMDTPQQNEFNTNTTIQERFQQPSSITKSKEEYYRQLRQDLDSGLYDIQ